MATQEIDLAPARVGVTINVSFTLPSFSLFGRALEAKSKAANKSLVASLREAMADSKKVTLSLREDRITSLLAVLLIGGLYLDGWNHINLQEGKLGPFLTPWHYVLYAGFSITAGWVVSRFRALRKEGAVPSGYVPALVGMGISGVGVAGDAVWHTVFGVETGITRVISPFHLLLFSGAALLVASSLRSGWQSDGHARVKTFGEFFPILLSMTVLMAMVAYCFQEMTPLVTWLNPSITRLAGQTPFAEVTLIYTVASILITNLLILGPVVVLLRRWQPPFGSITFLFGTFAALTAVLTEFSRGGVIAAFLAGGLVADLMILRFSPSPTRRSAQRLVLAVTPLALWTAHFGVMWLAYGQVWVPEIWIGTIFLTGASGYLLMLVSNPAPIPAGVWATQEAPLADVVELAPKTVPAAVASAQPIAAPIAAATAIKPVRPRRTRPLQARPHGA